jgi:hypothetical protein
VLVLGIAKRLLVGRPVQSDHLGHTLLPKKIARGLRGRQHQPRAAGAQPARGTGVRHGVRDPQLLLRRPGRADDRLGGTWLAFGHPLRAESAGYQIRAARQFGGLALVFLLALALVSHVHVCPSTAGCIGPGYGLPERTVIAQVGRAVFGGASPLFYLPQLATALILVLAANTAINGFPV